MCTVWQTWRQDLMTAPRPAITVRFWFDNRSLKMTVVAGGRRVDARPIHVVCGLVLCGLVSSLRSLSTCSALYY
jgi:hypothetical protein